MIRTAGALGVWWCAIAIAVAACGDSSALPDREGDRTANDPELDAGSPACRSAADCDDGLFCTGLERCDDGLCSAGTPRDCDDGVECTLDRCDEDSFSCLHLGPDADGDGFADARCTGPGGLPFGVDCDDDDALRYPGNVEVCDPDHHDEDCDVTTYGARDVDGDLHNDLVCCNVNVEGTALCGDDCDDTNPDVAPSKQEVCNDVDDNCSGSVDEGLPLAAWYPDCDGDAFGDATGTPITDCSSPPASAMCDTLGGTWVSSAGDCDELAAGRNPGAPEVCNFSDDDCDGLIDDVMSGAVFCYSGEKRLCINVCGQPGEQACDASCLGFGPCLAPEACNACDDDGDGAADDGFACARGLSEDCTTPCGTPGTRICNNACDWGLCRSGSEACNYCDDDGDGNLIEERVMATEDTPISGLDCSNGEAFGTAWCEAYSVNSQLEFYAPLLDGTAVDQEAAYWIHTGDFTGWGRVVVTAELQVRTLGTGEPLGGWSLVVADEDTSTLGVSKAGAVGIAVDWNWAGERGTGGAGYPPDTGDRLVYRRLSGTAPGEERGNIALSPQEVRGYPVLSTPAHLDAGDSSWVTQKVVLDYTPDDPVTGSNEELIAITIGGFTVTYKADFEQTTADPNWDMPLHVPLVIGFVAQSRSHTYDYNGAPPGGDPFGTEIEARVRLATMDFPTGVVPPYWDYYSFYSREEHCPGL
jgi:hypothetical protein